MSSRGSSSRKKPSLAKNATSSASPSDPKRTPSMRARKSRRARKGSDSEDESEEESEEESEDEIEEEEEAKRATRRSSKDQMKAMQRRKRQKKGEEGVKEEEDEEEEKEEEKKMKKEVKKEVKKEKEKKAEGDPDDMEANGVQDEITSVGELSEDELVDQVFLLAENERKNDEWYKAQPDQCCICLFDTDEMGPLVLCDGPGCEICVHQECYGILNIPENWFCDRCADNKVAACVLCPEKTGALKRTVEGNYVHVVCALWMDGTTFVNEAEVGPVSVEGVPSRYWNLKCSVCKSDRDASYGACAPCDAGRCKNNIHITCAQKWGLLEDKSTEEEDMANPYFIFCKSHGPTQPPKMEEWYRWINKRPTVKPSNNHREQGWLSDLPLNYFLFARERDEEIARLKSGLVALEHQTVHLQKNIHTMREARKKFEEQIPASKESKKLIEQELEELKASLTTIFNGAHSNPLDQPLASNLKIFDQFRAVPIPASKAATPKGGGSTPKNAPKASPSPVRRGKPLLPARVIYPRMSADFPEIPNKAPVLQPLTLIKRSSGKATGSAPPKPALPTSNVCRVCANADYQREGRGDPATAPYLLECATCGGKFHMGCLEPPLEKRPRVGYVWSCVDCESGTSSIDEEEPDLDTAVARTRSKTSSLPPVKKTFDEQLEEIETREIEEKFKQRERSSRREKGSSPRPRPESPSIGSNKKSRLSNQEEDSK